MAKKRRKKNTKALISKEWRVKDGLEVLPELVRSRIDEVLRRLKVGDEQQAKFFNQRFTPAQRCKIAFELVHSGVSYPDLAKLLGVSLVSAHDIVNRAMQQVAAGLSPVWMPSHFIDSIHTLEEDAAWNRSKSESAMDDETALAFRRNATAATAKSGELLVKVAESDKIAAAIRESSNQNGQSKSMPDAVDRVDVLQWVFENKILKQIEPPIEDAQVRESDSRPRPTVAAPVQEGS